MLAGDFTAFASAACNTRGAVTLKTPFVNNRIDPKSFDPVAVKLAALLPKADDACGQVLYGQRNPIDDKQWVAKIDYQASAKHSVFGRVLASYEDNLIPKEQENILSAGPNRYDRNYAFTIGSTYLLSPSKVNAFRVSYSKVTQNQYPPNYGTSASALGSKVYDYLPNVLGLNITSGFTLTGNPRRIAANLYQIADDVSLTRGTHQFGFGGRVAQSRTIGETGDTILPNFTISGEATGTGLSDFLLGKVASFLQGIGSGNYLRMKYVSLYAQDAWQLKPRST